MAKKQQEFKEELEIPEGIKISLENGLLTVTGKRGEIKRDFFTPVIKLLTEGNKIIFTMKKFSKREKTLLGTFMSHIRNMFIGVTEGFVYKLKICSGHFPMNVSFKNHELIIKNFIGEKVPRVLKVKESVNLKVEGDIITLEANDIEIVGLTASSIEKLTRRPGFDKRIFQQGIYITDKPE